ncbi:MAG: M20/M25/M40 family metallo-hydrolase [Firmicutes bacterium]|nr:M20/M25/M40 family metallo-hydrolase [Bacillota bacterium]
MDHQRIISNLTRLVEVPSVSGSPGEDRIIDTLREMLMEIDYFREHPGSIKVLPTLNDPRGRRFITAFLPGEVESGDTVILMSHVDVVGVEEFGTLKGYAFNPEEYLMRLRETELPPEVSADAESGEYMFGRGVLDMKFGIALHLEVLHQAARVRERLRGNLLFLAVPDEEDSSVGMLSAVPELLRLKREGLNLLAAVNSEPFFPRFPGDTGSYLYTGTVGKVLLFVYAAGQSTHGGSPFAGLNVNLLLGRIVEALEMNPYLTDGGGGDWVPPPVCLKMSDLRQDYSVQTPVSAYAYFNITTLGSTPGEVLEKARQLVAEACSETVRVIGRRAGEYSRLTGRAVAAPSWDVRVFTFSEFLESCAGAAGTEQGSLLAGIGRQVDSRDLREGTRECFETLHRMSGMSGPLVVLGFAPPYYPYSLLGSSPAEERVRGVVDRVISRARNKHREKIEEQRFFPGLSDMSYLRLPGGPSPAGVEENTPLWGERYLVPLKAIAELDVPFINIGPRGRDVHKPTERLHLPYSLRVTADLIMFSVSCLLEGFDV